MYIGTKIIYFAIISHGDNKKEILTMDGVQIITQIVDFILENSFTNAQGQIPVRDESDKDSI